MMLKMKSKYRTTVDITEINYFKGTKETDKS